MTIIYYNITVPTKRARLTVCDPSDKYRLNNCNALNRCVGDNNICKSIGK